MINEAEATDLNGEAVNISTGRMVKKADYYELVTRSASLDGSGKMVGAIAITSRYNSLPEYADVKVNQALDLTSAGTSPKEIFDLFSSVEGVTQVELILPAGDSIIAKFGGQS